MDLSCLAAISIPFTHGPFQSIRCDFVAASFNENAFSGDIGIFGRLTATGLATLATCGAFAKPLNVWSRGV
jgi:hypothetical protein